MANTTNSIDRTTPLAAFLSTANGDATNADIIQSLKDDEVGFAAAASQQSPFVGQLALNMRDDAFLRAYALYHRHRKLWEASNDTTRDALGSDNGLITNDVAFKADTSDFWYCVSVDGASSSTWLRVESGGGPQHFRVDDSSGLEGVTNDLVTRWSGSPVAGGSDIGFVPDSDLGDSWNFSESGVYSVSVSCNIEPVTIHSIGIHVASSITNDATNNLRVRDLKRSSTAQTMDLNPCWTGFISSSEIMYITTSVTALRASNPELNQVSIARVG